MNTVIEYIINNLSTGLLDINPTNGYSNKVEIVETKILKTTNIQNNTVCIGRGTTFKAGESSGRVNFKKGVDIFLILHCDDENVESFVGDFQKYFYANSSINPNYTCSLLQNGYVKQIEWVSDNVVDIQKEGLGKCAIWLKIYFADVIFDIDIPSIPTLTTPSNNATSSVLYTPFNWENSIGTGSITYELLVSSDSDFTNNIISVKNITFSSFTIPLDNPLTDGETYYWKVRATNIAGVSNYSDTHNYLVELN